MNKKSFFRNLLNFIGGNYAKKQKANNITPEDAISLQKQYFVDIANSNESCSYSPPYAEIAKQLFSAKPEIFRATVFYLVQIAENETKYLKEISTLLLHFKEKSQLSPEDAEFLDKNILDLDNFAKSNK